MVVVVVVVEMEAGVSDWVGGSDFTPDLHCDPELGEEGGLGTGDVRAWKCWTVVVSTFINLAFSLNMTRVFLSTCRE